MTVNNTSGKRHSRLSDIARRTGVSRRQVMEMFAAGGATLAVPTRTAASADGSLLDVSVLTFDELEADLETTFRRLPYAEKNPMSGSLDTWSEFAAIDLPESDDHVQIDDWDGEDDLSVATRLAYDDEHLYVAADVTDDVHQAFDSERIWQGDSIQLGVADGGEYGPEYGFAHVDGESDAYKFHTATEAAGAETIDLRTRDTDGGVLYEAAFPWETLFADETAPSQSRLPFSFIVNENDVGGRKGWLQWTPAIGSNKNPDNLGLLGLVDSEDPWSVWFDGPTEVRPDKTVEYVLYLPNYDDTDRECELSIPLFGVEDETVAVPADHVAKVPLTATFEENDEFVVSITATDVESGTAKTVEQTVTVFSVDGLNNRFDEIEADYDDLDDLLADCADAGIPTEYETVAATVVEDFLDYGREDVTESRIERARYVADELRRLVDETTATLEAYLDGEAEPSVPPRYTTSRPAVENTWFTAETRTPGESGTAEQPVFFNGVGGFSTPVRDLPKLHDYGINVIHQGFSPNDLLVNMGPWYMWNTWIPGVDAEFEIDSTTTHSGKNSLRVSNGSPESAGFATVYQDIEVEPDTTYQIEVWAKGQNASTTQVNLNHQSRTEIPGGDYDWQQVTHEITTGSDQTSFRLIVVVQGETEALWLDDLAMIGPDGENAITNPGFEGGPGDRAYRFDDGALERFGEVLAEAEETDVSVIVMSALHIMPDWVYEEWPDFKADPPGRYNEWVLDHPEGRQLIEEFLRALVSVIAEYDSVHSLSLLNEPNYRSTEDPWTREQWPAYLEEQYGDVETLNAVYEGSYDSFEDVPAGPNGLRPEPRTYDWQEFNNDRFADFFDWAGDIVEDVAPNLKKHVKIMGYDLDRPIWNPTRIFGIDPEKFAAVTDVNGNDNGNRFTNGPSGFREYLQFYDLQRSLDPVPAIDSETHLIKDGYLEYPDEVAPHVRTNIWQGVVRGRSATSMWVWERTYDPSHPFSGSMLHRPDVVEQFGRTTLDMNRLAEELTALQAAESHVAILYSKPGIVYAENYMDAIDIAYDALSYDGQKVDFISEAQVQGDGLAAYDLLIIPATSHVEADTIRPITEHLQGPDRSEVVTIGSVLERDERDRPFEGWVKGWADSIRSRAETRGLAYPADVSVGALREDLYDLLDDFGHVDVTVYDADTDELVENVEWRSVVQDERTLINVANYTSEAKSIRIEVDGEVVDSGVELINDAEISSETRSIPGLTPALFAVPTTPDGGNSRCR